jgi:hypothetical protein
MKKPEKPTRALAMAAQCHECLGRYADGIQDCENVKCTLYTWMPKRKLEPDLWWLEYNPRKKGLVKWEYCGRDLTDEQRQELRDRLKKSRQGAQNEKVV